MNYLETLINKISFNLTKEDLEKIGILNYNSIWFVRVECDTYQKN
jgi:hypothetical protein